MKTHVLGRTGIEVSELSLGTVSIGFPYGIEKKSQGDLISEPDAIDFLNYALDRGINFFDTAMAYGCSEERIGKAFKGKRDQVVISTKCPFVLNEEDKSLFPAEKMKRTIEESLAESLARLQTDYVDVYMLHIVNEQGNERGMPLLENDAVVEAFTTCRDKGMARAIGVSVYTPEESKKTIESGTWDAMQLAYNLMNQTQSECFELARARGVGIVARSVIFKGILTDKVHNLHPELVAVENHRETYSELLTPEVPTLAELAMRFVMSEEAVSTTLIGTAKKENLDRSLAVADGRHLDAETRARAKQLAYPDPEFLDLATWFHKGWTS